MRYLLLLFPCLFVWYGSFCCGDFEGAFVHFLPSSPPPPRSTLLQVYLHVGRHVSGRYGSHKVRVSLVDSVLFALFFSFLFFFSFFFVCIRVSCSQAPPLLYFPGCHGSACRGHTGFVTDGQWHPADVQFCYTSSLDSTMRYVPLVVRTLYVPPATVTEECEVLRVWDVNACETTSLKVIKCKNAGNTRVGVTSLAISGNGKMLAGGWFLCVSSSFASAPVATSCLPKPIICFRG